METRITTLVENSSGEHKGLRTEHGLSFLVERGATKALFDLGQSGAFVENAAKLRKDLSGVELVAISHGHYDHSGGLRALVDLGFASTAVVGGGFFDGKYATDGVSFEYLGNDFDGDLFEKRGIKLTVADKEIAELAPGIFILSSFPRLHADEVVNPRFLVRRGGGVVADDFSDEICMAVGTERGFVLLLGCAHPGMKNMIDAARKRLPGPIVAVLGGTHLVEASPVGLEAAVAYFVGSSIEIVGVSHCTGSAAGAALSKRVKGFYKNTTGHELIL